MDNKQVLNNRRKPELEIVESLRDNFAALVPVPGLKVDFDTPSPCGQSPCPDFIAHVSLNNLRFKLIGEITAQPGFAHFDAVISQARALASERAGAAPVIVAKYLSPSKRQQCADAGVNFIDLSGNVLLAYKDLYIERIGFPNQFPEERKGRGPFSDKASLILRTMLEHKNKAWGTRELAQSVALDPGFVSRIAREMESRAYIVRSDSKLLLQNRERILEDWVHEYDYRKNRERRYFCLAQSPQEILGKISSLNIPKEIGYALGLHAGANLVAPHAVYNEVHIYVRNEEALNYCVKHLRLEAVDRGANLVFLMPYYGHSVFFSKQLVSNLWTVSDIQLYLDLYNFPVRGREQAEYLYEKRLKYLIEDGRPAHDR